MRHRLPHAALWNLGRKHGQIALPYTGKKGFATLRCACTGAELRALFDSAERSASPQPQTGAARFWRRKPARAVCGMGVRRARVWEDDGREAAVDEKPRLPFYTKNRAPRKGSPDCFRRPICYYSRHRPRKPQTIRARARLPRLRRVCLRLWGRFLLRRYGQYPSPDSFVLAR